MKNRISSLFPDQNFQQGRGGGGGGGGAGEGGGADGYGLDLTCDRRAATVSGDVDGEWRRRRRVAMGTAAGD